MRLLVTGGASGLGAAVVSLARARGWHPIVLDKSAPADELVDLSDSDAAERTVRAVAADGLDAVVAAAGVDACGPLDSVSTAAWEHVVRVNLFGTAAVVRAALPYLKASKGRVVTIASTLGLRAVGDATAYCASKFGVVGFTRALAAETAGQVGVTLVVPGGMRTSFFDGRTEQYRPASLDQLNPPENVANAILFALNQPAGCELRELVVCHSSEPSWP